MDEGTTASRTSLNNLQIRSKAMGKKVAPSFVFTYMGAFEEQYVYTYRLQHPVERNWTHILKTLVPQGLNLEASKQYT